MQASRLPHRRVGLSQLAQSIRLAMVKFASASEPSLHFPVSAHGGMRNWSRKRMQVVQRYGCRCYRCGRLGDEITLQICLERLAPLCGRCQRDLSFR